MATKSAVECQKMKCLLNKGAFALDFIKHAMVSADVLYASKSCFFIAHRFHSKKRQNLPTVWQEREGLHGTATN
jgi:hypothetical protein